MFREDGFRPNDTRGFLHKSFIGKAVGGFVKKAIPAVGIASGIFQGARQLFGKQQARPTAPRSSTARPTLAGSQGKQIGRELKFGFGEGGGVALAPIQTFPVPGTGVAPRPVAPPQRPPCDFPKVRDAQGRCRTPTSGEFGGEQFGVGAAVMGQFGVALQPGSKIIERSVCLPGMQLAKDGLCYNKGAITNSQRMWPRGRRPLLTGGDMRAISIAARAGAKLDRTTKRLRSLGMMRRLPAPRKAAAHAHAKPIAAVSV